MKSHHCPEEQAVIEYEGECNWCGEKEMDVIKLAKEAGFDTDLPSFKDGTAIALKFAALVRAEREWVDLTDDDVAKVKGLYGQASFETIARAVIAAFKEKNK